MPTYNFTPCLFSRRASAPDESSVVVDAFSKNEDVRNLKRRNTTDPLLARLDEDEDEEEEMDLPDVKLRRQSGTPEEETLLESLGAERE